MVNLHIVGAVFCLFLIFIPQRISEVVRTIFKMDTTPAPERKINPAPTPAGNVGNRGLNPNPDTESEADSTLFAKEEMLARSIGLPPYLAEVTDACGRPSKADFLQLVSSSFSRSPEKLQQVMAGLSSWRSVPGLDVGASDWLDQALQVECDEFTRICQLNGEYYSGDQTRFGFHVDNKTEAEADLLDVCQSHAVDLVFGRTVSPLYLMYNLIRSYGCSVTYHDGNGTLKDIPNLVDNLISAHRMNIILLRNKTSMTGALNRFSEFVGEKSRYEANRNRGDDGSLEIRYSFRVDMGKPMIMARLVWVKPKTTNSGKKVILGFSNPIFTFV